MSMAAVLEVNEAQKKAEAFIAEETRKARALIADAENGGAGKLDAVKREASEENARMMKEADVSAEGEAEQILKNAAAECEGLRTFAESKLSEAAARVAERIVNG